MNEAVLSNPSDSARRRRRCPGKATENGVDDVGHEAVGEWGVAVEESVVKGPVEHVEGHLDVDGSRDLAAGGGPGEGGSALLAAGFDEAGAVLLLEGRVGLGFGDEGG